MSGVAGGREEGRHPWRAVSEGWLRSVAGPVDGRAGQCPAMQLTPRAVPMATSVL